MSQAFTLDEVKFALAANKGGKHSLVASASELAVVFGMAERTIRDYANLGKISFTRTKSKQGKGNVRFRVNQELVDDLNGLMPLHERVA